MRIPLGNFDSVKVSQQPTTGFAPGGDDPVGEAVGGLGQETMQIASRMDQEAKQKTEDMARAQASDQQLKYEYAVNVATLGTQDQLHTGAITYQDAMDSHKQAIDSIPKPPPPAGLPPDMQQHYETGLWQAQAQSGLTMQASVIQAREADYKSTFASNLDTIGKLAGLPGSDIEQLNKRVDASGEMARRAGLDPVLVTKTVQDAKDSNWTQQANQRYALGKNDIDQLNQLSSDLTDKDGYYADKLDANKRNAILSQVVNRKQSLLDRAEHQQDRSDARGERTIAQFDKQIASGVPATPEMMTAWSDATKGTSSAADFADRVKDYETVQQVTRLPFAQQQEFVQKREAELMTNGGTVQDQANLDRMKAMIDGQQKQLMNEPLVFNQTRLGDAVEPINMETLANKATTGELGNLMQHRAATITAMRKQYGSQVPMKLLLPQEATALQAMMTHASPSNQAQVLGLMNRAINDDQIYSSVMKQLTPSNPVVAYAGNIIGSGRVAAVDDHNLLHSDDVAQVMLDGQRLLDPTDKGTSKFPMPSDSGASGLRAEWNTVVGDGFRGNGAGEAQAYQAFRAMYAGLATKSGKVDGVLDSDLAQKAAQYTVGNVIDWDDHIVIPPYGMDQNVFRDAAAKQWDAQRTNIPGREEDDVDGYSLDALGDGVYSVSDGQSPVVDKSGKPVIIRVGAANYEQIDSAAKNSEDAKKPSTLTKRLKIGEGGGDITPPTPDQVEGMR